LESELATIRDQIKSNQIKIRSKEKLVVFCAPEKKRRKMDIFSALIPSLESAHVCPPVIYPRRVPYFISSASLLQIRKYKTSHQELSASLLHRSFTTSLPRSLPIAEVVDPR